jgi:hypothetical protein
MTQLALLEVFRSKAQRLLFVLACCALTPWLLMRFVRELLVSNGVRDYLGNVFVTPVIAWFQNGWWGLDSLPWYDCLLVPAFVALLGAFFWPVAVKPVLNWIRLG